MTMKDQLIAITTELVEQRSQQLTPLSAGILAAAYLDLASDSRSFARKLDIAHALVLRECVALSEDHGLLTLTDRSERSQRLFFALTTQGDSVVAAATERVTSGAQQGVVNSVS